MLKSLEILENLKAICGAREYFGFCWPPSEIIWKYAEVFGKSLEILRQSVGQIFGVDYSNMMLRSLKNDFLVDCMLPHILGQSVERIFGVVYSNTMWILWKRDVFGESARDARLLTMQ